MSITPYYADEEVTLHLGDSLDILPTLADASVDAVVCDPPYGLADLSAGLVIQAIAAWMAGDRTHVPTGKGFMGRDWDRFVPPPGVWDQCLRVLKPGGHLLAFAGSRTVDLMTLSIRIAGFEIRDSITWLYGSGMPKSLDVSKAIDKAASAQRKVIGQHPSPAGNKPGGALLQMSVTGMPDVVAITAPATADAARWEGWGTGLKPASEPIVVARKPLAGTVAATVLQHGTGALNIDGCRLEPTGDGRERIGEASQERRYTAAGGTNFAALPGPRGGDPAGRWPTNVILSHPPILDPDDEPVGDACADGCVPGCPVTELDRQSGIRTSGTGAVRTKVGSFLEHGGLGKPGDVQVTYGDTGGASRFFPAFRYEAKAPASERPRLADGTAHPTVKPVALLSWLVRLVTPPGGLVLDPFAGSGTTLQAAVAEGMRAIGIEQHQPYADLTVARLSKPIALGLFGDDPAA